MKAKAPDYSHKGNLTQGPVQNHLIRLTLPMVWGIFAIISFQLADTYYISLLGTQPLAAISFTFPVTFIIFSIIMGFGIAMSSVVSRQIGEGNMERVKRIVTHGLFMAFLLGLSMAILGFTFMNTLFSAMGADNTMLPMIDDYMSIWFAGSVLICMPMVGNAAIRASGDSMFPALIMTVAAVTNIVLDPILIFGLFGFPRMELQGAATATVFANGGAMLAGLYVLYVRKKLICRDGLHLSKFTDSLKRLGFIAIPAGLTSAMQPLTNAVLISILATYSAEAVAAFGVVTRLEAFAFTIIMALATGMAPIIGQNWGAGLYGRVHETINKAFLFAALWSLLVALIFIAFAEPIAAAFSKENSENFIHICGLYFWLVSLSYVPGNLVPGWGSAFNAMGMPQRSFLMISVKLFALQIPLAYAGSHYFGITGLFGSMAVTNVLTGVVFHIWNWRVCKSHEGMAGARGQKETPDTAGVSAN